MQYMENNRLDIDATVEFEGFKLEISQKLTLPGCTAILGPSGSGKTTLLRLIAGFQKPNKGCIRFGDLIWFDSENRIATSAHERNIGFIFQDGRLFPHLTVEKNLLYADKRNQNQIKSYGFGDIVEVFNLAPLLARHPNSLSGGERQRVALARTLITTPDLLLLDEPLSALDHVKKADILPYLDSLYEQFGAPVIYVTHNIEEIVSIAEQTMIINAGKIDAIGPTADVLNAYNFQSNLELSAPGAILTGVIKEHDENYLLTHVAIGDTMISLPINLQKQIGSIVRIHIDPRNVAIASTPPSSISIRNMVASKISDIATRHNSPFLEIELQAGGAILRAQITRAACDDLALKVGQPVYALIKTASFML